MNFDFPVFAEVDVRELGDEVVQFRGSTEQIRQELACVITLELAGRVGIMAEAPVVVFDMKVSSDDVVDMAVFIGVIEVLVFACVVPSIGLKGAIRVKVGAVAYHGKLGDLLVGERLPAIAAGGLGEACPCIRWARVVESPAVASRTVGTKVSSTVGVPGGCAAAVVVGCRVVEYLGVAAATVGASGAVGRVR